MNQFFKYFILGGLLITFSFRYLAQNANSEKITVTIPGSEVNFQMVLVPATTFSMGSPAGASNVQLNEMPQRKVEVDDFYISTHEVSYDEFIIFYQKEYDTDITAHPNQAYKVDAVTRPTPQYIDYTYGMGKSGYPAVSMTQQAALRYCQWLYDKTGYFYRLPTEAEWEIACHGGLDPQSSIPDFDLTDYAWFYENSDEKYHEVGKKKPNPFGIYDMLGNVAEWTLDYYQEDYLKRLEGDPAINPWVVPERRHTRTVRGGSYNSDAEDCRCAARQQSSPSWQARDPQIPKSRWWNPDSPFVGFRLVRPLKKMTEQEVEAFFAKAIKD